MTSSAHMAPRLLAVSDIHGFEQGLKRLIAAAGYRPRYDRLILLGDYINAGHPGTYNTLRYVRSLIAEGAFALAGNHEVKLLEELRMKAAPSRQELEWMAWLERLPLYRLEDGFLFVHAGVRPGIPLERQTRKDLTEIRSGFLDQPTSFAATVVFGHTPTCKLGAEPGELWRGDGKLGIDTGAKHGQRLTLLDLGNRLAYSCAAHGGAEIGAGSGGAPGMPQSRAGAEDPRGAVANAITGNSQRGSEEAVCSGGEAAGDDIRIAAFTFTGL